MLTFSLTRIQVLMLILFTYINTNVNGYNHANTSRNTNPHTCIKTNTRRNAAMNAHIITEPTSVAKAKPSSTTIIKTRICTANVNGNTNKKTSLLQIKI